ncbi:hypothetical protein DRH14_03185, partial [Candidatus Shapirobacteria bacterium]
SIKRGGLILFPSDTVYILAVDPLNQKAVDKLLAFKNRWTGKAISIAVNSQKMAKRYVQLSDNAKNIYQNLLPGPFTIISQSKEKMAKGIEAEDKSLGVRIPDNQYILDLIKLLNRPITATSANLSGRSPHYSVESFLKRLSDKKKKMIDVAVDAGKLARKKPSTVIDSRDSKIKILREGDMLISSAERFISKSEKETIKIANFLYNRFVKKRQSSKALAFCLKGELGIGKSVFSRAIAKNMGVKGKVLSPTFTICNEYKTRLKHKKLVHIDLYRIQNDFELEEINFLDLFKKNIVACVEWPENMGKNKFEKLKKKAKIVLLNFKYLAKRKREINLSR